MSLNAVFPRREEDKTQKRQSHFEVFPQFPSRAKLIAPFFFVSVYYKVSRRFLTRAPALDHPMFFFRPHSLHPERKDTASSAQANRSPHDKASATGSQRPIRFRKQRLGVVKAWAKMKAIIEFETPAIKMRFSECSPQHSTKK